MPTPAPRRSRYAAASKRDFFTRLPVAETRELQLDALTPSERDSFFGSFFADTAFEGALDTAAGALA